MEAGTHIELVETGSAERVPLREAARLLEVPEARLRSLARAGFFAAQHGPIGPASFGPEDLAVLRATRRLIASGVTPRRLRRTWAALRRQLESGAPLESITIEAEGDEVVASDGRARWNPDSGQFLLDLDSGIAARIDPAREGEPSGVEPIAEVRPAARPRLAVIPGGAPTPSRSHAPAPLAPRIHPAPRSEDDRLTADEWYEIGCDLEASSAEGAREAYERALELNPHHGDSHVNLGRHWHVAGERGRAEPHYREAVRLAPDDPTPHFNLGVLLDELGRKDEAILAYRQALQRDPEFADAHCNLGLLLDSLGRRQEAMRHLMAARELGEDESP